MYWPRDRRIDTRHARSLAAVRWLGEEPAPHDLMRPFPAEPMHMWPISTRVNKPENDDPSIVEPFEAPTDAA
jgi:putative SOS response-associated peptidase YedK